MIIKAFQRLALLGAALALAGCDGAFDPFQRPGNWSPTGEAQANINLQAAYKSELLSGRGTDTSNGVAASAALDKALGASGAGTAAGLQTPETITVQSNAN